jgi:hypothetical protein
MKKPALILCLLLAVLLVGSLLYWKSATTRSSEVASGGGSPAAVPSIQGQPLSGEASQAKPSASEAAQTGASARESGIVPPPKVDPSGGAGTISPDDYEKLTFANKYAPMNGEQRRSELLQLRAILDTRGKSVLEARGDKTTESLPKEELEAFAREIDWLGGNLDP